jgi:hypothetical protein
MSRVEELNQRIWARNIGDTPQFYFSPRPVPTKYTTMPIVDERIPAKVDIKPAPVFDTTLNFLPGTSAPWSGKIDQIDTETDLIRPKDYIPSSKSDLYKYSIPSQQELQPFPLLFASVRTSNNGIKTKFSERQLFNNDTRIKNIY